MTDKQGRVDPTRRGVWFQGACGFWHRSRYDAGKIACIQVDGHRFFTSDTALDLDLEFDLWDRLYNPGCTASPGEIAVEFYRYMEGKRR